MALQTLAGWLLSTTCEEFYVFGTATLYADDRFYQVKARKRFSGWTYGGSVFAVCELWYPIE